MDHGDMDMGGGSNQCSMNMLFTFSSKNLCIVFPQWRVTGPLSLILSLLAIVLLTAGYEGVRDISRRYDAQHKDRLNAFGTPNGDILETQQPQRQRNTATGITSSLPLLVGRDSKQRAERTGKMVKAALYAVQVFYSFFIMLLFMTYNGWVMLAVAVGAFVGYLMFSADMSSEKTVACH